MSDRPVLSHSQFAKMYGGSREYETGKAGKRGGYYVSRDPRVPAQAGGGVEEVSNKPFDVEATAAHFTETKDVATKSFPTEHGTSRMPTAKERANVHQGIWTDTNTGKTHLDISDRVSSLSEGLRRGINQNQLGIYAAGSGKTLETKRETATGMRETNPAAAMTAEKYGEKEKQWKKRSRMTKQQRSKALSSMSEEAKSIRKIGL